MRTALGLRAHSGWAALVAVGGTIEAPHVLERRRLTIANAEMAGSKQPYHAAAGLPAARAGELLEAILAVIGGLRGRGNEVVGCGVVLGSGKALPELPRVLASHALIHTAEGEMFREVLVWAAKECGLPVTGGREKDLDDGALRRVDSLGKLIGPPWTQDQK